MVVDDLPTGSWFLFFANVFISWFFQFIGFLFAYLLHTTHAAKYGARVGLGMTLIQFGFYSRRQILEDIIETTPNGSSWNETIGMMPGMGDGMNGDGTSSGNGTVPEPDAGLRELGSHDWMAFLLMTLGGEITTSHHVIILISLRVRMVLAPQLTRRLLPGKKMGELDTTRVPARSGAGQRVALSNGAKPHHPPILGIAAGAAQHGETRSCNSHERSRYTADEGSESGRTYLITFILGPLAQRI